jgi:hypothetical protein
LYQSGLALTPCGSAISWAGAIVYPSHKASTLSDAIVCESVRALGRVSTTQRKGRI